MNRTLHRLKCTRFKSDPCLHVRLEQDGKGNLSFAIIAIYDDDIILTSSLSDLLELVSQEVMVNYKMRVLVTWPDALVFKSLKVKMLYCCLSLHM